MWARSLTSSFGSLSGSFQAAQGQFIRSQGLFQQSIRFATKKAGGSSRNGRDSQAKRLGVKKFGGEPVIAGNFIMRQRGQKMRCGPFGVKMGRDHTIFAVSDGWVYYKYDVLRKRQTISVLPVNPNQLSAVHRNWVYGIVAKRGAVEEATLLADRCRNNPEADIESIAEAVKKELAEAAAAHAETTKVDSQAVASAAL
jgi:large subunit ribosomal protein L27